MGTQSAGGPPRERILAAARRIVAERGMTALSVQAVASAAGVTKSSISYHFGGKDGLVRAVIESLAVKDGDESRRAIARIEDAAQRFHAFMDLYLDRVRNHENFRIAFALGPTPYNEEKMRVYAKGAAMDFEALHLRKDDPSVGVLMAVLMSAITGLAFNYVSRGSVLDLDACFAELERAMAPAFLRAMAPIGQPEG